jgi:uncharacterized protein
MTPPTLASLHVYPVKSVRGHDPSEAAVEPWGLAGDRRWMLVDSAGRVVTQRSLPGLALVTAQLLPSGGLRLAAPGHGTHVVAVPKGGDGVVAEIFRDKVELVPADPAAHAWLSSSLGAKLRLMHLDDPASCRPIDPDHAFPGETVSLADGFPLLLTARSSLDALNSLIAAGEHAEEGPLPMNRFRPNLVVEGTPPWAEDGWRRVAIGDVTFRVAKKSGRCVVTTTDQLTAVRGSEPLHTLARHRRFGHRLVFGQNLVPETTGTLRTGDPFVVLE